MVKVTFTLDDDTVDRLRRIAARLAKPQSQVVREAIKEYEARADKLSDEERRRMLAVFDALVPKIPSRPRQEIEAELREIRYTRRHGWRENRGPHRQ
jgi:metal-responsive CopG/Arc/MetJ family transcriptional regulator